MPRRPAPIPDVLPEVFTYQDALSAGRSPQWVRSAEASGRLLRLARGSLARPGADPQRARLLGLLRTHGRDLVVSHGAAAALYGLPTPLGGWGRPTATAAAGPTRTRGDLHVFVADVAAESVREFMGMRVTTPGRTVVDCARHLRPADALAIADAALRRRLVARHELKASLDRARGTRGVVKAREVLALVDPSRESPLESWSRWCFHRWDVPAPQWQVDLYRDDGRFIARADCLWRQGLVGEADGRAKYRLAAAERGGLTADTLARVLDAERAREAAIRSLDLDVIRWGARDVRAAEASRGFTTMLKRRLKSA